MKCSKQKNKREEVKLKIAAILDGTEAGVGVGVGEAILKNTAKTVGGDIVMFFAIKGVKNYIT